MNTIQNKIIVVCSQNFNGYGMLRSLGEIGIRPIMLVNWCSNQLIKWSRFKGDLKYYDSVTLIPEILLTNWGNESKPPVVICCDDAIQSVCDANYNILKDRFLLSKSGGVSKEV